MDKQKIKIWGREFELDVSFYAFDGNDATDAQKDALDLFLKANASCIPNEETGEYVGGKEDTSLIDSIKADVEKYCLTNANGNDVDDPITNIFKYVIPKCIFVDEVIEDSRIVALLCDFKFDMEHGLAIVFENEKFDTVGDLGMVL